MNSRTWTMLVLMGLGLAGWIAIPLVRAEPAAAVDGDGVSVEADRLDVDLQSGRATMLGSVRVRRGKLDLSCGRLEARVDRVPVIRWARATDGVRVRLDEWDMRGGEVEWEVDRGTLRVQGEVLLRRGGVRVQARDVVVDLGTQRLVMEQVRGVIPVSSGVPMGLPLGASSAK